MDYDNPQFVAAVKKVLGTELIDRLTSIQETIQRLIDSKAKATNPSDQHQQTPSVLRAELKVPPSERYEQESKAARQSIIEHLKLWLEVVGILVVLAYTSVTALQLREMFLARKQTQDAVKAAQDSSWRC